MHADSGIKVRHNVMLLRETTLLYGDNGCQERKRDAYQVHVVLALLQFQERLPVTCELFLGNTTDVKMLELVLEQLKQRFALDRITIAADAGLLSEKNLAILRSFGCDYVVVALLRSLNKAQIKTSTGSYSGLRKASVC